MVTLLLIWVLNALALIVVAHFLPGFQISSFATALLAALVLGLLNAIVRPVILLLTLPFNLLTLGLFTFVINALMLLLAARVVHGFQIDRLSTAVWAAVLLWLIGFATNAIAHGLTAKQ